MADQKAVKASPSKQKTPVDPVADKDAVDEFNKTYRVAVAPGDPKPTDAGDVEGDFTTSALQQGYRLTGKPEKGSVKKLSDTAYAIDYRAPVERNTK